MTAGQGGPEHPGWQQFPPSGYQPYHAAPPSWGGPPPEPMERPLAARVGIGAFLAATILSLLGSIVTFLDYDGIVDEAIDQAVRDSGLSTAEIATAKDLAETFATVGIVIGAISVGVYLLFIWFAWHGRQWARIVLWVFGGLGIVSGLVGLASPTVGFLEGLNIFQLLLLLVGVVALAQKPVNDWYRAEKWRRSLQR